jgi:hypothetical protein
MEFLDGELVTRLRAMAGKGDQPSAMLHAIVAHLSPARVDQLLLVRYFAAAFHFKDGQGHPIHGWFPDGTGELKDADIDRIMSKRIRQTRTEWENPDPPPEKSG